MISHTAWVFSSACAEGQDHFTTPFPRRLSAHVVLKSLSVQSQRITKQCPLFGAAHGH